MKSLVRYQVDCFRLEDALTLSQLQTLADEGRLEEAVMPVDEMFAAYPAATVTAEGEKFLMNGNPLPQEMLRQEDATAEGIIRVYDQSGRFQALYASGEKNTYRPWKTFFQA